MSDTLYQSLPNVAGHKTSSWSGDMIGRDDIGPFKQLSLAVQNNHVSEGRLHGKRPASLMPPKCKAAAFQQCRTSWLLGQAKQAGGRPKGCTSADLSRFELCSNQYSFKLVTIRAPPRTHPASMQRESEENL